MGEDISVNLRAFKKKTSVINNARIIVTVADTSHHRRLYTRFKGSNYELALIVSAEGRPFMDEEKSMLDKGEYRKQLAKTLKEYVSCTENGIVVDWNGFSSEVEQVARELLIEDKLGLARLKPLTIQRKEKAGEGSDTPLVATGQLADAIICYPEYGV
jgi:hypothetical protein